MLIRNTLHFSQNATTGPIITLTFYTVLGTALAMLFSWRHPLRSGRRLSMLAIDRTGRMVTSKRYRERPRRPPGHCLQPAGMPTSRRRPSTRVVSLPSAWALSRVWAMASSFSPAFSLFALTWDLNSPMARSMSRGHTRPQATVARRRRVSPRGSPRLQPGRSCEAPGSEPVVPARHFQARRQPLDLPVEGTGQGLVQIIDVEDQPPLGEANAPNLDRCDSRHNCTRSQ